MTSDASTLVAVSALSDDLRRRRYGFIRRSDRPVTRDEAAESVGISRKLAAFHLDKLVDVIPLSSPGRPGRREGGRGVARGGLRRPDRDHRFAAGDVASAHHPLLGTRIRVEHWANALNQPATAARAMLGRPASYDRLPYFYTDQYDLGMEYTGHAEPGRHGEVVVRGDLGARRFIAFWMADGQVLAGMNVNIWDVTEPIKQLIRSGAPVDRAKLADPGHPPGPGHGHVLVASERQRRVRLVRPCPAPGEPHDSLITWRARTAACATCTVSWTRCPSPEPTVGLPAL